MAMGFRRRLASLTVPKAFSSLRRTQHKKLSYIRTRSAASLPGRFHPVVVRLHDSGNALLKWTQAPAPAPEQPGTAWISDGADNLGRLLASLTDLLHHLQAQQESCCKCKTAMPWTERLLDDLLLLADAHGCFRDALLSLKPLLAEAHAAVRRRDAQRLVASPASPPHCGPSPNVPPPQRAHQTTPALPRPLEREGVPARPTHALHKNGCKD